MASVHPHACGDNRCAPPIPPLTSGPPPRMWGQRQSAEGSRCHARSTPTHVGTTGNPITWVCTGPVHPHACGDNPIRHLCGAPFHGPPPRMWGQRVRRLDGHRARRSTPTHVGTTIAAPLSFTPLSVHPHACGDNAGVAVRGGGSRGPPPRMWGQPRAPEAHFRSPRSTPTHVGTTGFSFSSYQAKPVHPHACGDNASSGLRTARKTGPPPRMWGQPPRSGSRYPPLRSTPTHVGTTMGPTRRTGRTTVHPHACGDNRVADVLGCGLFGPPPRMWGQLLEFHGNPERVRSTPTHVGTT